MARPVLFPPGMKPTPRILSAVAAALFLSLAACGNKSKPANTAVTTSTLPSKSKQPEKKPGQPTTATITPERTGSEAVPTFAPIRFDFDSAALSQGAREELQEVANWMGKNRARVTIEGHADERGTDEYNLALGQQRAEAISRHLVRLGVDGSRLKTITFGEERPASSGSDEGAWAANRRGELDLQP